MSAEREPDITPVRPLARIADALEILAETAVRQLEIAKFDHAVIRRQLAYAAEAVQTEPCQHPLESREYDERSGAAGMRVDCLACGAEDIKHGATEAA